MIAYNNQIAMRRNTLVLNKNYWPIRVASLEETIKKICADRYYPFDLYYKENEDGSVNMEALEGWDVIKSWDKWVDLEVRDCDDFIKTSKREIRYPSVCICAEYSEVRFRDISFPTKKRIWERDKNVCGYTGKKLERWELSVDHIIPTSRGGENSWENLITCDKLINSKKSNKTPEEAGLKLLWKPTRPSVGMVAEFIRDDWGMFVRDL